MARRGGASTLTGVDYQILYTANRFAEAVTVDSILVLRPEAHVSELAVNLDAGLEQEVPGTPAVDDLTITHRNGLTEYISLKHQAGQAVWTTAQFIGRDVLDSFFRQHQANPAAQLLLVTQSPVETDLHACIERAKHATGETLSSLGSGPAAIYQKLASYVRQHYSTVPTSDDDILRFLSRIDFLIDSGALLLQNTLLRLQPHTQDAQAASNVLYQYAMQAGKQQHRVTPDSIRQELAQQGQAFILPPTQARIIAQFEAVSSTLNTVPATIGHQPGYHIDRADVTELVEWILTPLPDPKPNELVAVRTSRIVIGGAGVGKTVVLRDVYRQLRQHNIPVLALKADRTKGNTKGALLDDIRANGLLAPLKQALAVVASAERPAVILVDQLDALSMCLGAERGLLTSYTELLNDLQSLPNIRFILSCRTFDLKHDPELAPFREAKQIEITGLTTEQVAQGLQAAGAGSVERLAFDLVKLLQIPLHLSLYCVLDNEARSGEPVTSLQGLYDKLLFQFLLNSKRLPVNVKADQVKTYLYELAETMYKRQQLTLSEFQWREYDIDAFNYLNSQAILVTTGPLNQQITFFHQTFYEYLFARQFVAKSQSLTDFVLTSGQGLFLRSLIQQVLVFLRGSDFTAYSRDLSHLITADTCRFHIKLLVTQFLATLPRPELTEITIAREVFLANEKLAQPFVEVTTARPWLELLTESAVFQRLLVGIEAMPAGNDPSLPHALLWTLAKHGPDLLLSKLPLLPEGPYRTEWLVKVMDDMGTFAEPGFLDLFDQVFQGELSPWQQLMQWHILGNQAQSQPAWVAERTLYLLANAPFDEHEPNKHGDHLEAETLKHIWEKDEHLCFNLCSRLLRTWIYRNGLHRNTLLLNYAWRSDPHKLLPVPYFLNKDVADRHQAPHSATDAVVYYSWKYLENPANATHPGYFHTVAKWLNSRSKLLVQMALAASAASPLMLAGPVLRLLLKKEWLSKATRQNHIGYYTRQLLPYAWDVAAPEQRTMLASKMGAPNLVTDTKVYIDSDGQRRRSTSHYGRNVQYYLQRLGRERLQEYPALVMMLAEFTRRWGTLADSEPSPTGARSWGYPTPSTNWKTDKMQPANWLRALRKYRNKEEPDFFSDEGTYEGLCHHAVQLIKENSKQWIEILDYLIEHKDESIGRLLPELCEVDATNAASLVEKAYDKQLLGQETYSRLRRRLRTKSVDYEQGVEAEFVQHDLDVILANLTTENDMTTDGSDTRRDLLMSAMNTTGASELHSLLGEILPEAKVSALIDVLHHVAIEGALPVRAAAVNRLAMLLRTSVSSSTLANLFIEIVGTNYKLLAVGQWSLNFLAWREPKSMFDLMENAINDAEAHESITRVLTVRWGHNDARAFGLLERIWTLNPSMRATTIDQLTVGYGVWTNTQVLFEAIHIFLLTEVDKALVNEFDDIFREFPVEDLLLIKPLLPKYLRICTPYFEYQHFFLDYLARCVSQYAAECVQLLTVFFQELNKTRRRYYYSRDALKILIEAYTRLPHQSAQDADVQAALDLFDELLERPDVRNEELKKVMSEVLSY
ncbi:NACHT domain-containing protein [Hymenobacter sp. HD11105]